LEVEKIKSNSLMIYCTHGTYGRDDDSYGALLAANIALAKGLKTTLVLLDDGVFLVKKEQNPDKIGLPNNLNEIQDFIDLGGTIIAIKDSIIERGVLPEELVDEVLIISFDDLIKYLDENSLFLTF